jgi:hypothetical protein
MGQLGLAEASASLLTASTPHEFILLSKRVMLKVESVWTGSVR